MDGLSCGIVASTHVIALASDNPDREIMGPMAAIITVGLASSTLLNLHILPVLMPGFGRIDKA